MFESSFVASQQSHVSSGQRWTAFASITLQALVAAAIITVPLLHPERMSLYATPPRFVPVLKMPKIQPVQVQQAASSASSAALPQTAPTFTAPHQIPTLIHMGPDPGPMPVFSPTGSSSGMTDGATNPLVAIGTSNAPRIAVAAAHPRRVTLSTGVTEGMLLRPIRPIYPSIAKAAHVSGTVVVEAIISKAGTIESLHVVSGSPMLREAAIEAIQAARYRPYKLNGEPTEVQTTITVNFLLNS